MDILDEELLVVEDDLLKTIWTKPTLTFQYLFKFCPDKYVTLLLVLSGIVSAFERSSKDSHLSPVITFAIAIIIGGLCGRLFGYISSALLSWTGRWLKGTGTTKEFMTVTAWAMIPSICSLGLVIISMVLTGHVSISLDLTAQDKTSLILPVLISMGHLALQFWTLVIFVKGIAVVQNFSIKKATLNLFLPMLIIVVPLVILAVLVIQFSGH